MQREIRTSVDVGTAIRILSFLEDDPEEVPMNNLKQVVKGVYKTKSEALDFLLERKLIKRRVIDSGKRTSTVMLLITIKGNRELERWRDE